MAIAAMLGDGDGGWHRDHNTTEQRRIVRAGTERQYFTKEAARLAEALWTVHL